MSASGGYATSQTLTVQLGLDSLYMPIVPFTGISTNCTGNQRLTRKLAMAQ